MWPSYQWHFWIQSDCHMTYPVQINKIKKMPLTCTRSNIFQQHLTGSWRHDPDIFWISNLFSVSCHSQNISNLWCWPNLISSSFLCKLCMEYQISTESFENQTRKIIAWDMNWLALWPFRTTWREKTFKTKFSGGKNFALEKFEKMMWDCVSPPMLLKSKTYCLALYQ